MANEAPPAKRRLVLCMGAYCNQGRRAEAFYEHLCEAFGDPGPAWMARRPQKVKWEIANCLSMCGTGPNLIIYPEDRIYNHLDRAVLERLIDECLREGQLSG